MLNNNGFALIFTWIFATACGIINLIALIHLAITGEPAWVLLVIGCGVTSIVSGLYLARGIPFDKPSASSEKETT